ncbi:MAG TPA: GNAT family N-acetyltransferase, partial [Kofleriaceae bacterium]|nr:GNAT family N-acetyltransferase [Kofleriaceae bacterium]
EPTPDELAQHAAALSVGYNEPRNAELMGHTSAISPAEVIENYTETIAGGMRAFLLFSGGELAGDADLRGLRGGSGEFAFMIAMPSAQGKGLGTRFATMIHAFGFRALGLSRIYASVVPHNTASRRVFEKLGYVVDNSAAARAYADEPDDVTLALDRATFERIAGSALADIRAGVR